MIDKLISHPLVKELTKNYFLSACEPNPISLSDEADLLRVKRAIKRAAGVALTALRQPVKRSSFLGACLDLTDEAPIEHLVVGYGTKHGNTTKIYSVHHVTGEEHSVRPTPEIIQAIWQHTQQKRRGEVVIFHNHPQNWLNTLLGNLPIASSDDRRFVEKLRYSPYQLAKLFFESGDVLFFLGENGCVKPFSLPSFDRIIGVIKAAQNMQIEDSN
jgi:hypothetical protein